ncbi:fimbrial protein [Atlantibacter sp.]|uniref:fimbrial protein n=1 Tax=Atlantibacter sp. TaxID=1903473 RepID=UPI0028A9A939|nr:fimbrial protein [Atlantibacter sp.]
MKKMLPMFFSALSLIAGAQGNAQAEDVGATLSITGSVTQSIAQSCSMYLSKNAVALLGDVSNLVKQGEDFKAGASIDVSIGANSSTAACKQMADEGKLAYKFMGIADDADGTVLSNSEISTGAAKGIGIGVFDSETKKLLKINEDTILAKSWANTFNVAMVKLNGQTATAGAVKSALTIQFERL